METQTKLLLGKILGEVYRIQRGMDELVHVADAVICGLRNGFEPVIDEALHSAIVVSMEEHNYSYEVLCL